MLLLLACAKPALDARLLAEGLEVQLDHGWTNAAGVEVPGARRATGEQRVFHPIDIPVGWDGTDARLVVDGAGWRVRAWIDGVEVGHDDAGGWPAEIDLRGDLLAGPHRLEIGTFAADTQSVPGSPLSAWTFRVPQRGLSQWGGRARLIFGPSAALEVTLRGGRVSATTTGATGAVSYRLVRDGAVLATWTDDTAWTGPTWPDELLWLVAEDAAGHRWQRRVGLREVTRTATGRLALNGAPTYLAARRIDLVRDGPPRVELFRQVLNAARMGDNAAEWHADGLSEAAIDVLDELGVPLVGVPRCAGRRQHDGPSGVDSNRDAWLDARDTRAAATWGSHPAAVAWAVEYAHPTLHPAFGAYRALGDPVFDPPSAGTIFWRDATAGARLPPWIIELPGVGTRPDDAARVAALIQAHVAGGGAGMEVPLPDDGGQLAATVLPALVGAGVAAWNPAVVRRGPALVEAQTDRPGTLVVVEVPHQPAFAAFADARGAARITVDHAGPASVRAAGGVAVTTTLAPGAWDANGWHPSVSRVTIGP